MHLLNYSLLPPSSITGSCLGHFSGERQQEICVIRGSSDIELLRVVSPTTEDGAYEVKSIVRANAFGVVRNVISFRLVGSKKDYIVTSSDSGRITILEYEPATKAFKKLHEETFGRSGSRRIVPGQYLAADPKGRAVMIAATEKSKLVYVLNRDSEANLTISSPLEAHRPRTIVHSIVGVDVGYENPLFAALEVDYTESDADATGKAFFTTPKMLTYYELDLGLNHIVRKWSAPTDPRANRLVQVPGGTSGERIDGPSGVLVCAEGYVLYQHQGAETHRVPVPRRRGDARPVLITAAVMHKMKHAFFFLLQSELGDLYKVTLDCEGDGVLALRIKYFETVPVAASLSIFRAGHLFVAAEAGPHVLYTFVALGDDDDEVETSSTDYPENGAGVHVLAGAEFEPHVVGNLSVVGDDAGASEGASAATDVFPITDSAAVSVDGEPHILAATGRGSRAALRFLQNGLAVAMQVDTELPGAPNALWAVRTHRGAPFVSYIVLSYVNGTLVFAVGETIEEATDSGLLTGVPTLAVAQIGADALVQVHPGGIRHITASGDVNEWRVDGNSHIVCCATNNRQVLAALSSGELVYFELDLEGQLNEFQERRDMGCAVYALGLGEVPDGRQRAPFVAVGCEDATVRILSLAPENTLDVLARQALTAPPSALAVADIADRALDAHSATTFVTIGLQNGVLLRTVFDPSAGQLTDTRTRFLGPRPIKLGVLQLGESPAIVALSTRTWLNYLDERGILQLAPLIAEPLDSVYSFSAARCPDGIIGVSRNRLQIFALPSLGRSHNVLQTAVPLAYTPRRIVVSPGGTGVYVVEAEHRTRPVAAVDAGSAGETSAFGNARAPDGTWASCLETIDPVTKARVGRIDFSNNEAAFSAAVVEFTARPGTSFLVVGTAQNVTLQPRSCTAGFLYTYEIGEKAQLTLLHKTETDDVPLALVAFQGRLAAGVGAALRIFDLGIQRLLRKSENKAFATQIVSLSTQGSRLIVGDAASSVHYVVYKQAQNRLIAFADDVTNHYTTCATMLDYDTVALGDKFGNLVVNRLDRSTSEDVDDDLTGAGLLQEKSFLMGAAHRTATTAHFFVGDIITSIQKTTLVPGGRDLILYTGLMGTLGVAIPFVSHEDIDFFSTLEILLRAECPSLVGRDHLAYRSSYAPVTRVVDGDLCQQFLYLPMQKQASVAQELDRTKTEVLKKLETARSHSW